MQGQGREGGQGAPRMNSEVGGQRHRMPLLKERLR